MKTYFTFMKESYTLYHNSYTGAVNAALQKHSDLKVSPEDRDTHIAMGPRKPAEGETVKHNIPATDKNGDHHMIHIQVYNKGGNTPFELNTYSSKVPKKKVAEETEMRHSSDSLGDHMALKAYANKLGPKHIDRHDLLTAASHMAFGNMDHLKKHLKALDTDVRDKALEYVARRHHAELGYSVRKEEAEQIDEISSDTLISYSQKAHNQIKGNQPADPDKLRKRTNREQGIKLAFNKHYQVRTKVPATIKESNAHFEVAKLKSKGEHHEAGVLAAEAGHDREYGVHFGMRSDRDEAQRQFFKGYDSVKKTNEEVKPLAEISAALAMRASRAATKEVGMGKSNREDKLIGLQKTADEKHRKMQGHSSSAKVATTPEE
jgi:hypothetical protein